MWEMPSSRPARFAWCHFQLFGQIDAMPATLGKQNRRTAIFDATHIAISYRLHGVGAGDDTLLQELIWAQVPMIG